MKRKTNVRSYERKDGTKVSAHDRTIDANDLPKVNADSYQKGSKVGKLSIATIRPETKYPESDYWFEDSYYEVLEYDITPDQKFLEFLREVEGSDWDDNVNDSKWSGNALSIEAPAKYIVEVQKRFERAWFSRVPKRIADQSRISIEWDYWIDDGE